MTDNLLIDIPEIRLPRDMAWRVKFIEAVCQLRPKSLFRLLAHPDQCFRAGMRWYSNIGRRVWIFEICQWLFFDRRTRYGPTLAEFLKGGWKAGWKDLPRKEIAVGPGRRMTPLQPRHHETTPSWQNASDFLPLARVDNGEFDAVSTKTK